MKVSFLSKYPIPDGIPFIKKYPLPDEMDPLESLSIENEGLKLTSFSDEFIMDGNNTLEAKYITCSWVGNDQLIITSDDDDYYVMVISPGEQRSTVSEGAINRTFKVKAGDFVLVFDRSDRILELLKTAVLKYLPNASKELIGDGSILVDLVDLGFHPKLLKVGRVGEQ
jgi:hypothetical protein